MEFWYIILASDLRKENVKFVTEDFKNFEWKMKLSRATVPHSKYLTFYAEILVMPIDISRTPKLRKFLKY